MEPDSSAPDPLIGKIVGGCKLMEPLGSGAMGIVYKAEQLSLGRIVAVKILPLASNTEPELVARFQREIAVLAKLNHPSIVRILDGGECELGLFFIMEHVDGVSLRQVLARGGLKPEESLQITRQLCDALGFAHAHDVVHRDVKPENVLIDRAGRVRLLDFGVSRILQNDAPDHLTKPAQALGTYEYMAPEQREQARAVDHRADLYSLGVVIYEMLTNELPIGRFDAPSRKNVQIDVRLDDVVLRSLEKCPDRRYQCAKEVRQDVEHIYNSAPPANPTISTPAPASEPVPPAASPIAATAPPPPSPPPPTPPPIFSPSATAPMAAAIASVSAAVRASALADLAVVLALMTGAAAFLTICGAIAIHAPSARFAMALVGGGSMLACAVACFVVSITGWVRIHESGGRVRGVERCIFGLAAAFGIPLLTFIIFLLFVSF